MPLKELDTVPELRDDPSLKDFNDVQALAKSFKDTKAFVGGSIRPPGPDASPEAKKEFYQKLQQHAPNLIPIPDEKDEEGEKALWARLGVPAKPEEYTFEVPKDTALDLEALRQHAVSVGMTRKMFEKLAKNAIAGAQKLALEAEEDQKALKQEWGAAYPDKLKAAAAIASKFGVPEAAVGAILAGKVPSAQIKRWEQIAKAVGTESKELGGQGGGSTGNLTPAEADAQFREIQANKAYWDKNDPQHETLKKKAAKLSELMAAAG